MNSVDSQSKKRLRHTGIQRSGGPPDDVLFLCGQGPAFKQVGDKGLGRDSRGLTQIISFAIA